MTKARKRTPKQSAAALEKSAKYMQSLNYADGVSAIYEQSQLPDGPAKMCLCEQVFTIRFKLREFLQKTANGEITAEENRAIGGLCSAQLKAIQALGLSEAPEAAIEF